MNHAGYAAAPTPFVVTPDEAWQAAARKTGSRPHDHQAHLRPMHPRHQPSRPEEGGGGNEVVTTGLTPVAEATRHRPDPNGLHAWDDGGHTLQDGAGHATNGDSYKFGGGSSPKARFRSTGTSERRG